MRRDPGRRETVRCGGRSLPKVSGERMAKHRQLFFELPHRRLPGLFGVAQRCLEQACGESGDPHGTHHRGAPLQRVQGHGPCLARSITQHIDVARGLDEKVGVQAGNRLPVIAERAVQLPQHRRIQHDRRQIWRLMFCGHDTIFRKPQASGNPVIHENGGRVVHMYAIEAISR